MAVKFSLVPGPSLDIVGIPDLEVFKKFIGGDLGIADNIREQFIQKTSIGIDGEELDTFNGLMSNNGIDNGIKSLEKTIIQSVFESQKPYIEVAKSVLDSLVVTEDMIAAVLAGFNSKSLKPISNPESLYSKLNKVKDDLDEVNRICKLRTNSFSNTSQNERMDGIQIDTLNDLYNNNPMKSNRNINIETMNSDTTFDFITVSVYYSTGVYIEDVPYKYSYRYLSSDTDPYINILNNIDSSIEPTVIPRNLIEDMKPVIIFDVWVDEDGNGINFRKISENEIDNLPWSIQDKWVGEWESWDKNPIAFQQQYTEHVINKLNEQLDGSDIEQDDRNDILDIVLDSIPFNDTENNINFHSEMMNSSIYSLGGDDIPITAKWNSLNKFGLKPRKINNIWYDPEIDYDLQIIRITPDSAEHSSNINITGNPLSNKYNSINIKDILLPGDYDATKFKFISHVGDSVTNRIRHANSYYNGTNMVYDKKIYYVIEGVHRDRMELFDSSGSNSGSDPLTKSKKYYKFGKPKVRLARSIVYVVSRFIKFMGSYVVKAITQIKKTISLFTKPHNFIFEILMEKVSDSFSSFAPNVIDKISTLRHMTDIEEKVSFVENDVDLKQLIAIDSDGNYRAIFDGTGMISFLGTGLGVGTKGLSPKLTINNAPDIEELILSADNYVESADTLGYDSSDEVERINLKLKAMEKLQLAQLIEPDNIEVKEKMDELQTNTGVQTNIMFQSVMEMVSLPIKIITKVIEYILDFFKSLRPRNIATKIPKFLTFEWIMDFFKPSAVLDLMGIKLNPSKLSEWKSEIDSNIFDINNYDTSQVFSFPIAGKLDTYNTNELPSLLEGGNKILLMINGLFKIIQEIVNSILCFLFNVFNIDSIIKCPKIKLAQLTDASLSSDNIELMIQQQDINFMAQLEDSSILGLSPEVSEIYNKIFSYDIKLENGDMIVDLTYEEMKLFTLNRPDLQYKYDFE